LDRTRMENATPAQRTIRIKTDHHTFAVIDPDDALHGVAAAVGAHHSPRRGGSHLAYGATVTAARRQQDETTGHRTTRSEERSSTVRSAVIGVASGLRSSTGVAAALIVGAAGALAGSYGGTW
ncbi:hypothetical protein P3H15_44245, partial [Rhodococcus sp. T2V]|nr:hypothetical protein [Rhodococcus sp. T2V]